MVKNLLSICNKIYSKLTGKDVQKIQSDIIDSLERELTGKRADLLSKDTTYNRQLRNKTNDCRILQDRVDALMREREELLKTIRRHSEVEPKVIYEKQFVMTEAVYQKFARSLEPPVVTNATSPQGAGYLVGIQRALEKMREQFVSGN